MAPGNGGLFLAGGTLPAMDAGARDVVASQKPATRADVRRAMWTIIAAVAIATVLIALTIRNSSPLEECKFLLDRVTSGQATNEEFDRWDSLGCGSMDI